MRVALVGDHYYPDVDGAPHYAFELSLQLAKLGTETVVITHKHRGQPEEEEIAAVKIKPLKGLALNSQHSARTSR